MLFKPQYLTRFADGFSESVLAHSRNAAHAVLLIHGVVAEHFYNLNIVNCINTIHANLEQTDFLTHLKTYQSQHYARTASSTEKLDNLIARFFDFYLSRLPILFRMNRLIHRGQKRTLADDEIESVSRRCFKEWSREYPDMADAYQFSGEYSRSMSLTRWFSRASKRDDHVYDINWLWVTLNELYPQCTRNTNVGNVTTHVLDSCFPMFWDHLQDQYRKSMFYYANLGWFAGDLDTDELVERAENKRKADCHERTVSPPKTT